MEEKKDKLVSVVATAVGFDNLCTRQPGEEFSVPESVFTPRPKLDVKGKPIEGEFYDPPSWFKRKEEAESKKPAKGGNGKGAGQGGEDLV